ncbi:oxidoreductase C-terminal domain-containing protein, partial [Brevundimonas sp. NPDC055320]
FSVFHLSGDRIVAVEAVNAPADFMGGRMLIGKGAPVDDALLADPTVSIKAVVPFRGGAQPRKGLRL